jgi:hypothetical protein
MAQNKKEADNRMYHNMTERDRTILEGKKVQRIGNNIRDISYGITENVGLQYVWDWKYGKADKAEE